MAASDAWSGNDRPAMAPVDGAKRLLTAMLAGLLGGFLTLAAAITYPAVIFAGPMAEHLGVGITLALFSGTVLGLVFAWQSTIPSVVGNAQMSAAVVLGTIAVVISELAPEQARLGTLLVVIAIATLSLGLGFVLLGALKLGNAIRYFPFPVIGGFLGYVAWLMIAGAIAALTGDNLTLANLPALLAPETLPDWLPSAALATALLVLQRRRKHFLNVPLTLLATLLGFWLWAWLSGSSQAGLLEAGRVLAPLQPDEVWSPWRLPEALAVADWAVVLAVLPKLALVLMVAMISLLMNATTLEVASRQAVDLNRELITAGMGNLAAGLGGGLPGYHSVSASLLPQFLGTQSRLVGLISAAICLATLVFGGPLLAFVPKLLVGVLLLYLAFAIIAELAFDRVWLVSRGERLVMLLVFVTLVFVGVVEGIVFGVVAGLAVFAINYARTDVVRGQGNGLVYASNVLRPPAQTALLEEAAEAIHVVRLQGFLFFGTAHRLIEEIGGQLAASRTVRLRFLVLDFSRVTGADSSAIASFVRLMAEAESQGFEILLAAVPDAVASLIDTARNDSQPLVFADLDHALEHAEEALLEATAPAASTAVRPANPELAQVLDDPTMRQRFICYAKPVIWQPGEAVIVQGEQATAMYFIETGQLTARLALADGGMVRVRTLLPGTVVGEVGCYLDVPRTLTLVAESVVRAWAIDRDGLERMRKDAPDLAADFHLGLVRVTAARLAALTRYLEHHDH